MLKLFSISSCKQDSAQLASLKRGFKQSSTIATTLILAGSLSACVGANSGDALQSVLTPEPNAAQQNPNTDLAIANQIDQSNGGIAANTQLSQTNALAQNQALTEQSQNVQQPIITQPVQQIQQGRNNWQAVPLGSSLPNPGSQVNYLENSNLTNTDIKPVQFSPTSRNSVVDDPNSQNSLSAVAPTTPTIDPLEAAAESRIPALYNSISHGKCDSEWAPKPKRLDAKRINPGDPYYIEIRMRNTPLMPVGHTFVTYGKLDGNGEAIDERMAMLAPLGGYAGAGLAAAIPVPGVLTPYGDDCLLRPETAYRVSLSAQKYEKLLLKLQQLKKNKPVYMLFAQNCNHFTQAMADAVGIKPPKVKAVPAVDYLYDMIEANEGIKVNTKGRSNIVGFGDRIKPSKT